jgi:hypothetical protein
VPSSQHTGHPTARALAHADLIVRVELDRQDLSGELIVGGRPTTTFTGWLGLLTALDQALDTLGASSRESGGA